MEKNNETIAPGLDLDSEDNNQQKDNRVDFNWSLKTEHRQATSGSRTPLWLLSGWGCRDRRLSRV